jgi:RNA polymerase sigma-70 factor (ECF subfamily)
MALMWVLERLSPEERAAFLMRQVFDHDYADIAAVLGKSEAACRQMVHRAQERVQQQTPRFTVHASSITRCWAASSSPPRWATARP